MRQNISLNIMHSRRTLAEALAVASTCVLFWFEKDAEITIIYATFIVMKSLKLYILPCHTRISPLIYLHFNSIIR